MPSRRDSVGGDSSRIFPWSPKAGVIQCSGGGGVVAEIFRALRKPMLFSGGGVVAEIFRGLRKPMLFRGGPGLQKAVSSRNFALMRHFIHF